MEDIYEAVKQAQSAGEAISMDIHLLPYISGDLLFRMDGRNYSVEAKINLYRVSNGQLSHMITSPAPNMPGFNGRMFHFSQSTQYHFTQLDQEAYFIPLCELPEDWYTSTLGSGHVSLEDVQAYRIDLSDPSWVSELVRIIKDTRDIIAKGPKKPRPVLQRNFKFLKKQRRMTPTYHGSIKWPIPKSSRVVPLPIMPTKCTGACSVSAPKSKSPHHEQVVKPLIHFACKQWFRNDSPF